MEVTQGCVECWVYILAVLNLQILLWSSFEAG